MLGVNLGLLLYGDVSVLYSVYNDLGPTVQLHDVDNSSVSVLNTVKQLIFEAIYFRVLLFLDIFAAIYLRGLQNSIM